LSADWIEGRFEGIYSGPRRPRVDSSRTRRVKHPRKNDSFELRRFGFEIESGQLRDFMICSEPDPQASADDRVIRQARVKRVRLPDADGPESERETALFDVHISDWQLKHPAESDDRAYGTIVGTLVARRRPVLTKSASPGEDTATIAQAPPPGGLEVAAPTTKRLFNQSVETDAPPEMAASLGWAEVTILLAIVFIAIGYSCGLRSAVIWLAPIGPALGLFWVARGGLIRGAPRALVGWLSALQGFVLWPAIALAWQTDCWPVLGSVQVALLAGPVVLSAILGSRPSLWVTGMIWTAAICSSYARSDALTCMAALEGDASGPSETRTENRAPRRTDEHGRWPVMPSISAPILTPGSGRSAETRPAQSAGSEAGSETGSGIIQETGSGSGTTAPIAPDAASKSAPRVIPSTDSTSAVPPPAAGNLPGRQSAPLTPYTYEMPQEELAMNGDRRLEEVDGGWLSPDHRHAPREHVLISIEQANRTPELFFGSGGAHRVYVPTDAIFEDGSSTPSRDAPLALARIAALLSLSSQPRVVLEVHSDSAGAQENQIALSQRRADNVRGWLIDRGHISPSRFETTAIGGGRPLVPPDGDYGAQQPNRRIEIRLIEEK
jgi:outer membrane protein OmpA-like peptidoglycan-associated protein